MGKCAICGKEFQDSNANDALIFLEHFIKEHKKELKETQKEIVKGKHKEFINNPKTFDEQKEIAKNLDEKLKRLK